MAKSGIKIYFIFLVLLLGIHGGNVYAQVISSVELINRAKEYDAKIVAYQGEAIGDKMSRGKFVWINVNDGSNAIGIWASEELARDIRVTGDYRHRGDRIQVLGVFNRSCPEHGGDLDIHAQEIKLIARGFQVAEKLTFAKARLVLVLAGILGIIWILIRLRPR